MKSWANMLRAFLSARQRRDVTTLWVAEHMGFYGEIMQNAHMEISGSFLAGQIGTCIICA
jgi:hypothetical protein